MKRNPALLLSFVVALLATAADAQTSTNQTNSVVRFRISYGSTLYGVVDVELFDADKPITVTNFLRYVQRADYDNSILHEVRPGFTVTGGFGTVPNPYNSNPFEIISRIPSAGAITNEFFSGTLRSNTFGTLAMAKETGSANSANSRWFFNLGNNSDGTGSTNLDTAMGGHTVFGQVTSLSGVTVLNNFNALARDNGIVDMSTLSYVEACPELYLYPGPAYLPLTNLPVRFTGSGIPNCVRYNDLFNVQISMLSGPDVLAPKGTVTFPKSKATLTNENFTARGTATDNVAVSTVKVYLNSGAAIPATGPTNWATWEAAVTNVPPGTNRLMVEITDTTGNISRVTNSFFRSVRVPLTLTIDGMGTVKGATNTQPLELTRFYTLSARPARGHLFDSWIGSVNTNGTTVRFEMKSNTALTAVFATNLFPNVMGTYNGLFLNPDPDEFDQQSSGFVTMKLGSAGAYSGKVLMNGKSHSFKGTFSPYGGETNVVVRRGTNNLLLQLAVDLTNGTDQITGTVTNNQGGAFVNTNFSWSAELTADRAVFHARNNPASQAGKYTALIPAATNANDGPFGDGFGTVAVTAAGGVSLAGTLADGTKASQRTSLSKDGVWPLYVPLYKDKGSLVSWVTFTNDLDTDTDLWGRLTWFKQAQPKARYYRDGFTNDTVIMGSRYTPPGTNRVIDRVNGTVGFTNGNLAADFANAVELDPKNKVVNLGSNKLTLTISKSSGLFNGSVTPPGTNRAIPFKGAILQRQDRGSGFFLGTNQSGRVSFGP